MEKYLEGEEPDEITLRKLKEVNTVISLGGGGFLNQNVEKLLDKYLEIYDIVLLNDPDMKFVDMFTKKVCML